MQVNILYMDPMGLVLSMEQTPTCCHFQVRHQAQKERRRAPCPAEQRPVRARAPGNGWRRRYQIRMFPPKISGTGTPQIIHFNRGFPMD